jgi:SPP1 family predicted phage head-tail adaptor
MSIGELKERITLQYATLASDPAGGEIKTWVDHATVWAKAWTTGSGETTEAKQTSLIRIQKFKIRFRNVTKGDWRIKRGNRYFAIHSIDPDEKREYLFLTCKENA